ncbi:MAG TPA: T9SS type A sorting domain-containing protein, partial [Saprospiraceae bacterium]|nr:T9SS type A sorting domain-containing protein [Saprospiraceae bacterium]
VALLLSAVPALDGDVERIQYILEASADPMVDPSACGPFDGLNVPNAFYGYGILNLSRALQLALVTSGNGAPAEALDWSISLAPNPVVCQLNLNWSQKINVHHIRMYDQLGRLVLSTSIDRQANWSADLQGISAGLYYLQLLADQGSRTIKVIRD